MTAASPNLLTTEEAAMIARCSIKTVRRAYSSGVLVAYRRRGSRAVLLDPRDVHAWAQGQLVHPSSPSAESRPTRHPSAQPRGTVTAPGPVRSRRFDLSADALGDRRSSKRDRHA